MTLLSIPQPRVGYRMVDPAFPDTVWTVVQHDGHFSPIYIQREDGRLFHHTRESWAWSWSHGYLKRATGERS